MRLQHGRQLAYCTNIHRGETWEETFANLRRYTLAVRDRVCPGGAYAIGLRLSDAASRQLEDPGTFLAFQRWLDQENAYVFTINGFPYGRFHGARVKENVYLPDWSSPERLAYTVRLFELLSRLLPDGVEGSVSTVPGTFKPLLTSPGQLQAIQDNLERCVARIARISERTGKELHLGLEPEPLCLLETSSETVTFLDQLRERDPRDPRLERHLGVNYDACHLAVEFEEPRQALQGFLDHGIRLSKIHLSNALKVRPEGQVRAALAAFAEDVYCHQVVVRPGDGPLRRYADLDEALEREAVYHGKDGRGDEWRIHFHVPLHSQATPLFGNTADHLRGLLDFLQARPSLCPHLEMETYTWEVLPPELKNRSVVDQLAAEYQWVLAELNRRGLGPAES